MMFLQELISMVMRLIVMSRRPGVFLQQSDFGVFGDPVCEPFCPFFFTKGEGKLGLFYTGLIPIM